MKYDDASWHFEGDFPSDLPPEAGATHIGMFLAWAILRRLEGERLTEDCADSLERVRQRALTGAQFLLAECDGKLTDEELDDLGNEFAKFYLGTPDADGDYTGDYSDVLANDAPSIYHVADTWINFDLLKPKIDQRFDAWRARPSRG